MSTKPHTTIPITLHMTISLIPIFPHCHISIFHAHYSSFLSLPTSLTTFLHLHGDSAHEKLATTTQVQGRFMPIVQEKPTVELVRVPNEMKIFKAYSKLRVVWMNEHHVGVRMTIASICIIIWSSMSPQSSSLAPPLMRIYTSIRCSSPLRIAILSTSDTRSSLLVGSGYSSLRILTCRRVSFSKTTRKSHRKRFLPSGYTLCRLHGLHWYNHCFDGSRQWEDREKILCHEDECYRSGYSWVRQTSDEEVFPPEPSSGC